MASNKPWMSATSCAEVQQTVDCLPGSLVAKAFDSHAFVRGLCPHSQQGWNSVLCSHGFLMIIWGLKSHKEWLYETHICIYIPVNKYLFEIAYFPITFSNLTMTVVAFVIMLSLIFLMNQTLSECTFSKLIFYPPANCSKRGVYFYGDTNMVSDLLVLMPIFVEPEDRNSIVFPSRLGVYHRWQFSEAKLLFTYYRLLHSKSCRWCQFHSDLQCLYLID